MQLPVTGGFTLAGMVVHLMKELLEKSPLDLLLALGRLCGGCLCKSVGALQLSSQGRIVDSFLVIQTIPTLVSLLVVVTLFVVVQFSDDPNPTDGTRLYWNFKTLLLNQIPSDLERYVWELGRLFMWNPLSHPTLSMPILQILHPLEERKGFD